MEANTLNLPVLALRGLTVFPHTNLTFDVERRISIKALEVAMESGQEIFLVTQRELNTDRPGEKDLYTMGTISRVTQILRLGKTSLRVMVEGGRRARLRRLWQTEPYLQDVYKRQDVEMVKKYLSKEQIHDQILTQKAVAVVVDSATAEKPAKKTAKKAETAEGEEKKPAKKTTKKAETAEGEEKPKKAPAKKAAKKEEKEAE